MPTKGSFSGGEGKLGRIPKNGKIEFTSCEALPDCPLLYFLSPIFFEKKHVELKGLRANTRNVILIVKGKGPLNTFHFPLFLLKQTTGAK